jgi:hypothetical protein
MGDTDIKSALQYAQTIRATGDGDGDEELSKLLRTMTQKTRKLLIRVER